MNFREKLSSTAINQEAAHARNRGTAFCLLIIFLLWTASAVPAGPALLDEWARFSKSGDSRNLLTWLRCKTKETLTGDACGAGLDARTPSFYGKLGIFITLVKGNRVRGCFGAFHHKSENIEAVLEEYLHGALRCDPRYPPADVSELEDLKIVLTLAGEQYPVDDINSVDISRFGIILTLDDNEKIVFVPAEIKSMEYLRNRMRGLAIRQIAAFEAVVIR